MEKKSLHAFGQVGVNQSHGMNEEFGTCQQAAYALLSMSLSHPPAGQMTMWKRTLKIMFLPLISTRDY